MLPMRSLFRVASVLSSLGLLIGGVWFAHRQAKRTMMPSSKDIAPLLSPGQDKPVPQTAMPGSKSGTLIMSGSKSFTGGTTISAGVLHIGEPAPELTPSSKSDPTPAKMIMSGSKYLLPPAPP